MHWLLSVFSNKTTLCCYTDQAASLPTLFPIIFLVEAIFCEINFFRFIEQSLMMRVGRGGQKQCPVLQWTWVITVDVPWEQRMLPRYPDLRFHSSPKDGVMVCIVKQVYVKALKQAWEIWPLSTLLVTTGSAIAFKKNNYKKERLLSWHVCVRSDHVF